MLGFIRDSFKTLFEICLWLNLIACGIIGGRIGESSYLFTGASAESGYILGFALGVFAGMLINIICGGIVAVFLDMSQDLKYMKESMGEDLETLKRNSFEMLPDKSLSKVNNLPIVFDEGGTSERTSVAVDDWPWHSHST
jgi:uncharacterized membrane protein required for colicin V production